MKINYKDLIIYFLLVLLLLLSFLYSKDLNGCVEFYENYSDTGRVWKADAKPFPIEGIPLSEITMSSYYTSNHIKYESHKKHYSYDGAYLRIYQ